MSAPTPSSHADLNNQADESKQPLQTGELSNEQLDAVSGGGLIVSRTSPPPAPPPNGPIA